MSRPVPTKIVAVFGNGILLINTHLLFLFIFVKLGMLQMILFSATDDVILRFSECWRGNFAFKYLFVGCTDRGAIIECLQEKVDSSEMGEECKKEIVADQVESAKGIYLPVLKRFQQTEVFFLPCCCLV